jgi:hypothetical protein
MKSSRHLFAGTVVAVATAAPVSGPAAVLAAISFNAID